MTASGAKRPVMDMSAPGGRTDMPRRWLGSQFDPKLPFEGFISLVDLNDGARCVVEQLFE